MGVDMTKKKKIKFHAPVITVLPLGVTFFVRHLITIETSDSTLSGLLL